MIQIKKAGLKQFLWVILSIILIVTLFDLIRYIIPSYKVIIDILSLIGIIIFGYEVLIHYSAVFTYTVDENRMKINRCIGKRNKEVEFSVSSVKYVSSKKPDIKNIYNFNPNIFTGKNSKYIVYDSKRITEAILIEADSQMNEYLKRFKNKN